MIKITIGDRTFQMDTIKVTIWNEFIDEKTIPAAAKIYPNGIHTAIAHGLKPYGFEIRTAVLEQPEHGLSEQVLNQTDVLIWWAHAHHDKVSDVIVDRVYNKVLQGMGLIVLHSGQGSKIFRKLMGTTCNIKWREAGEKERIWVVDPAHPITEGLGQYFELEQSETYGEYFDIPAPDDLIFISWFEGGEVFRSGCAYYRRQGKIFYFEPGHETHPIFYDNNILRVISNAVRWAASGHGSAPVFGSVEPLESGDRMK